MILVVRLVCDDMCAMRVGRAAARVRTVVVRMIFGAMPRVAARVPLPRARERNQSRDKKTKQRKEDDRLIHAMLHPLPRHGWA
jgi:hypothetical protein